MRGGGMRVRHVHTYIGLAYIGSAYNTDRHASTDASAAVDTTSAEGYSARQGGKNVIKRSSGVLMHISSLPGPFEIGTMGSDAKRFIRQVAEMGCSYWQILPLNHLGDSRSPYSCRSLFALNPAFIDVYEFTASGLLSASEITEGTSVDDAKQQSEAASVTEKKRLILMRKAFSRLDAEQAAQVRAFADRHKGWLDDYALFCALKNKFDGLHWYEWTDIGLRLHKADALQKARESLGNDIFFWQFIQWAAYGQWSESKSFANSYGVYVIGDIPIYASFDSSDVWSHSELFQLNTKHIPKQVAGVPPDYFNRTGQLWGNPLYDWDNMRKDGFAWWMSRIENALGIYDIVRIDHFRGFHTYWSVPFANKTAKKGEWELGPGMDFVKRLKACFPDAPVVVEDLGDLDADAKRFFADAGFPGMRVMQFGFGRDSTPEHRLKDFGENCVAYTGTHDNNTVVGWYEDADQDSRLDSYRDLGLLKPYKRRAPAAGKDASEIPSFTGKKLSRAWVEALFKSDARVAIAPIQDLLAQGGESRMNLPGSESPKNWSYRVQADELRSLDIKWVKKLNTASKRYAYKDGGDAASGACSDS